MLTCVSTGGHDESRARWLITGPEHVVFPVESQVKSQVKNFWPSGEHIKSDHRSVIISLPGSISTGERASCLRNFETWVMAHQ